MRASVGKFEGNTTQQMLNFCKEIISSSALKQNFPQLGELFSFQCEPSDICCREIVVKTIYLTLEPSVLGSFSFRKFRFDEVFEHKITNGIWDFESISRHGTARKKSRKVFTSERKSDSTLSVLSNLRSTSFECITLHCFCR